MVELGAGVQIIIGAKDQFSAVFDKAQGKIEGLKNAARSAVNGLASIGSAAISAAQVMGVAFGTLIANSLRLKASFDGVQIGFSNAFGSDSQRMLNDLKEAVGGTASEMELMKMATQASLMGLPVDILPTMFKNAAIVAATTGRQTNDAIGDITLGISRQSRMILDNLGIIVNVEKAEKEYAATLGRTVEQLTDAERKTAFLNAAMEGLARNSAKVGGEIPKTFGIAFQRMMSDLTNFQTQLGTTFLSSLQSSFKEAGGEVSQFSQVWEMGKQLITSAVDVIAIALGGLAPTAMGVFQAINDAIVTWVPGISAGVGAIVAIIDAMGQAWRNAALGVQAFGMVLAGDMEGAESKFMEIRSLTEIWNSSWEKFNTTNTAVYGKLFNMKFAVGDVKTSVVGASPPIVKQTNELKEYATAAGNAASAGTKAADSIGRIKGLFQISVGGKEISVSRSGSAEKASYYDSSSIFSGQEARTFGINKLGHYTELMPEVRTGMFPSRVSQTSSQASRQDSPYIVRIDNFVVNADSYIQNMGAQSVIARAIY